MANEQQIATAQGNGNSDWVEITRYGNISESHLRTLFVQGTFNGATVKYQVSPDAIVEHDVPDANAITSKKVINVEHRAKFHRINVAGGGVSEAIDAFVV